MAGANGGEARRRGGAADRRGRTIRRLTPPLAVAGALFLHAAAAGQGRTVVREVKGFACMSLDDADVALRVQTDLPPIRRFPSDQAPIIGYPTSVLGVPEPRTIRNGFLRTTLLDWRVGWIKASHVRPFHTPDGRPSICWLDLMSDGTQGTDIRDRPRRVR